LCCRHFFLSYFLRCVFPPDAAHFLLLFEVFIF
jgi:hypothetical protein